jgi:hypothetical protein
MSVSPDLSTYLQGRFKNRLLKRDHLRLHGAHRHFSQGLEEITMTTNISRRDFLKIVFCTVPAVALAAYPIVALAWPEEEKQRPVAEPFILELEDGYLVDPDYDYDDVPDDVDIESLGPYQAAQYTPYAPGITIFERFGWKDAQRLGLHLIEGDHPGSSFTGVEFVGDVDELNAALAAVGLNLMVRG